MSGRYRSSRIARCGHPACLRGRAARVRPAVTRIDPAAVTDLSGRWNDTDSRLVANELITLEPDRAVAAPLHGGAGGEAPVVIVGEFRNRTMEHIPVNTFVKDLELAYVNSGAVRVVAHPGRAGGDPRRAADQQENARADTRARMAQETGARYMLQGNIEAIEDREGRER
jgi:penicillin-binding protein activator